MPKVIAICGKICSGKTWYANELKRTHNAVLLSCDGLTKDLFDNDLGSNHDEMAKRIWHFYKKQSVELVRVGCNVILDWGFWRKADRAELAQFYKSKNIPLEWHYIDISDALWHQNIAKRNALVASGNGGCSYCLDEGLLQKLLCAWEEPSKDEIDVWKCIEKSAES